MVMSTTKARPQVTVPNTLPLLVYMLRKASEARVNRRLRRYYLIVLLLPNIFDLACLPLSSIWLDTGHLMMLEFPLRLHPCRLCHGNSEILDRRSFRSDATLFLDLVFP